MKINALAHLFLSAIAVVPGTLAHDGDSPAQIVQTYTFPIEYEVNGADGVARDPPLEDDPDTNAYIPKENIIAGIKAYKNKLFLNVPRLTGGVPASIATVDGTSYEQQKLVPWPNWESHNATTCKGTNHNPGHGIAFSTATEVVPPDHEFGGKYNFHTLWVIDTGVTDLFANKISHCKPSVIIYNIETGEMLDRFYLEGDIADPDTNWLNDLVVDHTTGWCYITDNNPSEEEFRTGKGGVIAVDMRNKVATRVWGESMLPKTNADKYIMGGIRYDFSNPINSIALQPDGKYVYYAPASSFIVYMIPTEVMQNTTMSVEERHEKVEVVGNKGTGSASMKFASNGTMFFTALNLNAMGAWTWGRGSLDQTSWIAYQDHEGMQLIDQLDFDEKGYDTHNPEGSNLWFVSNQVFRWLNFRDDKDWKVNIWKAEVGTTDYFDALEITAKGGDVPVTTVLTSNYNVLTSDKSSDSYGNGPYGYNSGYNSYGDAYYKKGSKGKKGKTKKGKSKGKKGKTKKYYAPEPHYGYAPEPHYGYAPEPHYGYSPEPYYGYTPEPHYGYEPGYDRQQPYYGGDY